VNVFDQALSLNWYCEYRSIDKNTIKQLIIDEITEKVQSKHTEHTEQIKQIEIIKFKKLAFKSNKKIN
jgi:hypothetical protein